MSNYLAIATVTATLNQLLTGGINSDLSGVNVSNLPPDVVITSSPKDTLNIFLYHVTPNAGYRNLDQPVRNYNGDIIKKPQLGLNLHYMITAIAAQNDEMRAQEILACAMRTLHESPVLTRDMISQTIKAVPSLASSDLGNQIELVKITPQGLTLEEISKLWSSFFQTNYRISATYEATVILLDSAYDSKPTLPVLTPQVTVLTFRQPTIQQVQPQILPYAPGAQLTITGLNLQGDSDVTVSLQVGDAQPTSTFVTLTDSEIVVTLPAGLTAGVKTVQVIQSLNLPSPAGPVSHSGFESNIVPFVLAPTFTTPPPNSVSRGANLTVNFQPPVAPQQSVSFLLGNYEIPLPARDPTSAPLSQFSIQIPTTIQAGMSTVSFPTGAFLFRMRVDNADSPTQSGPSGPFSAPTVTVT